MTRKTIRKSNAGITKNDGEINLFINYGPVKIAGEDDDI